MAVWDWVYWIPILTKRTVWKIFIGRQLRTLSFISMRMLYFKCECKADILKAKKQTNKQNTVNTICNFYDFEQCL